MPVHFINPESGASDQPEALFDYGNGARPECRVLLWPHRSLPPQGFVWFIGITCVMLSLPLIALLGTAALWGLLPFLITAVIGIWFGLMRSYRTGRLIEEVCLWRDKMSLVRLEPSGNRQEWQANPYWVELRTRDEPVEKYLTLRGGDREVELGAFLSPTERQDLKDRLEQELRRLGSPELQEAP